MSSVPDTASSPTPKRSPPSLVVKILAMSVIVPLFIVVGLPVRLFRLGRHAWWALLAVAWSCASAFLSIKTTHWEWFARSGAVLTLAGAWLSGRAIWQSSRAARTDPNWTGTPIVAEMATMVESHADGTVKVAYDAETRNRWAANRREARAAGTGVVLALIGTFIWGYGDWFAEWLTAITKR